MDIIRKLSCATLLALMSFCCIKAAQPQLDVENEELWRKSDFRLIANIKKIDQTERTIGYERIVHEFYSSEQQRARIELYKVDSNSSRQQEIDVLYLMEMYAESQRLMRYSDDISDNEPKCRPTSITEFADELYKHIMVGGFEWLKKRSDIPDYVIGAARLLFIVANKRDRMEMVEESDTVKVRNLKAVRFDIKSGFQDISSAIKSIRVSYAQRRGHFGGFDLPLRIHLQLDDVTGILIDYFIEEEMNILEETSDIYPNDIYAFPLTCGKRLDFRYDWSVDQLIDASFSAQIFRYNELAEEPVSVSNQFVAYYGGGRIMRRDTSVDGIEYRSVIDFFNRHEFNIQLKKLDPDEESKQLSPIQCIATNIDPELRYFPFLNFDNLVPMGKAKVRGIECLSFEQTKTTLPVTLFPHIAFTDKHNILKSMFNEEDESYDIIYYFSTQAIEQKRLVKFRNKTVGRLMRVDVYKDSKMIIHMDIKNFNYHLVAAPNGDRIEELFTLKDSCSSVNTGNKVFPTSSLSMKLVHTHQSKTYSPESFKGLTEYMKSNYKRHLLFMEGIIPLLSGSFLSLYDIKSRMKQFDKKLEIYYESRVSIPDIDMHVPQLVGYAEVPSDPIQYWNSQQCFLKVAHLHRSGPMMFTACSRSCSYVNYRKYSESNKTSSELMPNYREASRSNTTESKSKSKGFVIHSEKTSPNSCPILLIGVKSAIESLNKPLEEFNWLYSRVRGVKIYTDYWDDGQLFFEAEKIEINNAKWSMSQGFNQAKLTVRSDELIDGVGFTKSSGQLESLDKDSTEHDIDYDVCHSRCMSWMSCKSFSICVTTKGIECITSGVDFRDEQLLEQLKDKRKDLATRGEKTIILTKENSHRKNDEIQLKLNARCKLYKKDALEIFTRLPSSYANVRVENLRPMDSLEKCAEICFKNNVIFLNRMQNAMKKLEDNEYSNDKAFLQQVQEDYDANMKIWCSAFKYLNLIPNNLDEETIARIGSDKFNRAGLCLLTRSDNTTITGTRIKQNNDESHRQDNIVEESNSLVKIEFENYAFLYSSLYKSQYGLRLKMTSTSKQPKRRSPVAFINRRIRADNEEECARLCFLQLRGLKPSCKSFDFIEYDPNSLLKTYCVLHTTSLAEVRRSGSKELIVADNVDEHDHRRMNVWHHEPRSYSLDSAIITKRMLNMRQTSMLDAIINFRSNSLALVAIFLISFVCSITTMVLYGSLLMNKLYPRTDKEDSMAIINEPFPQSLPCEPSSSGGCLEETDDSSKVINESDNELRIDGDSFEMQDIINQEG